MRIAIFGLLLLGTTAIAAPVRILSDFELTDQNDQARSYCFPKAKVTVMTVADRKGSNQLAPWIQALYDRYGQRIDIDGVADVSMIPTFLHAMFREAFRHRLAYSVMLDWQGVVASEFAYTRRVANVYVIDRDGRIAKHVTGPMEEESARELFREIDDLLASLPLP
jgi:hypothetical protein